MNLSKKLSFAKTTKPVTCKKLCKKSPKTLANPENCITFAPALQRSSLILLIKKSTKLSSKVVGLDKTNYLSNPDFLKTK
ncbi:hypothetical protein QHT84_11250 [Flavobacterium sp. YZ-48]|uniref:Uncharacterized protein n=1 Tax=Flavobacterium sedimenticola TaxID=3043286 RepID=A0ABT6XSD3_9FLAO|nr:hypothetical protein [Flavobacterium sedimenticola]